jgi:CheY-like chemotaxis protein
MSTRILVVDDSPTIRKVVSHLLDANGYETLTADNGEDAIQKLRDEKVDIVLTDFVMPRMNGYQFCREVRSDPELQNLPIVLMSAKGDKIRGQFVQQTGAMDAITKPFDPLALVAVIENALARHKAGAVRTEPPPPSSDPGRRRRIRAFGDGPGAQRRRASGDPRSPEVRRRDREMVGPSLVGGIRDRTIESNIHQARVEPERVGTSPVCFARSISAPTHA